jgi:hypothetical protein
VKAQTSVLQAPVVERSLGEILDGSRRLAQPRRSPRREADLGELEQELYALRFAKLFRVAHASACESVGFGVGKDAQAAVTGRNAGTRRHACLSGQRRVMCNVRRNVLIRVLEIVESFGDSPVH